MKTFIAAILLFSVTIVFVGFNYFKINKISADLISVARSLPDPGTEECLTACAELQMLWEASRDYIGFSCGISRIDSINDLIDALILYSSTSPSLEFGLNQLRLINAFKGIAEFESFRPQNIF